MKNEKQREYIKKLLQKNKMTLKELEKKAGMSENYLSRYFSGLCNIPAIEKMRKIANILNVTESIFFDEMGIKTIDFFKIENESLKETIKNYEKLNYIFNNYDELIKMQNFLNENKKILEVIKQWKI